MPVFRGRIKMDTKETVIKKFDTSDKNGTRILEELIAILYYYKTRKIYHT